jgi:hypothetical protein
LITSVGNPIKNFLFANDDFFRFFAVKLGHFIINEFFFLCNKHTSLTLKIGKLKKGFIGSASVALISPTIYFQILHQFPFDEKLQTQT